MVGVYLVTGILHVILSVLFSFVEWDSYFFSSFPIFRLRKMTGYPGWWFMLAETLFFLGLYSVLNKVKLREHLFHFGFVPFSFLLYFLGCYLHFGFVIIYKWASSKFYVRQKDHIIYRQHGLFSSYVFLFYIKVYNLWIILSLSFHPIALRTYEIQKGYYVPKKGEMPMKILMLLVMGGMYVYFRYWAVWCQWRRSMICGEIALLVER